MEYQFCALSFFSERKKNWNPICNLQQVTIALWGSVDEMVVYFDMPFSYTICDAGAKSVVMKSSKN
jgi:hypothetical protein